MSIAVPAAARPSLLTPLRQRDFRLLWTGLTLSLVAGQLSGGTILIGTRQSRKRRLEQFWSLDRRSGQRSTGVGLGIERTAQVLHAKRVAEQDLT